MTYQPRSCDAPTDSVSAGAAHTDLTKAFGLAADSETEFVALVLNRASPKYPMRVVAHNLWRCSILAVAECVGAAGDRGSGGAAAAAGGHRAGRASPRLRLLRRPRAPCAKLPQAAQRVPPGAAAPPPGGWRPRHGRRDVAPLVARPLCQWAWWILRSRPVFFAGISCLLRLQRYFTFSVVKGRCFHPHTIVSFRL